MLLDPREGPPRLPRLRRWARKIVSPLPLDLSVACRLPANLTIVHQSPEQMPGKTAAAVFDDVKSLVCIELGVPM
jgi:hypothetical protein